MTSLTHRLIIMGNIGSYLGFAVKSGKIIYGLDNIYKSKRRKYALVLCPSASENLARNAAEYAEKHGLPLLRTDRPLEEIIFKRNCKLIALLDANMAKAAANGR